MSIEPASLTPRFDRIQPQFCINARLRRLHRFLNGVYQARFKPYGLQGSMRSVLFIIGKRKRVNQKTIAGLLVLDPSTMSRDLKKLVKKGWVTVLKGEDPRHSLLELSPEGCTLLEEVAPVWERLHTTIEAILGKYKIQQIDHLTAAVQARLKEMEQEQT